MGVYIRNITKEQFVEDCNEMGVLVITEGISEIDLVRCGECKHLKADGTCDIFADDNIRPSVSDFCSYGERRNE